MKNAIVIGAGLSGLMGALVLAESGLRPLVVAKGQGTTHWTGGTLDILNTSPGQSLHTAVKNLIAQHPEHPYARLGMRGIEEAVGQFHRIMAAAHYPYVGSLDQNVLLPTAMGALRPTAFMPLTMAAGDVQQSGDMLIAGFHDLRDFFPPLIAANLAAQGIPARGIYIELPAPARRLDYSTRTFAKLFDDPAFRLVVGNQLRLVRGKATRIGLPAVLGLHNPLDVLQDLQTLSGAQIFEIPTLPASVPGMRLFNIFHDAITAAGGRFQIGSQVNHGTAENGNLLAIHTAAAAREQEHRAKAFLLATGGIAGGGIRTDYKGSVWETALNLPIRAPASREDWFASRFLHSDGQPIFRIGVVTDEQLRPVNSDHALIYRNVVVAGSLLSGSDPVHERCTTGLAVTTGWYAGRLLASMLGIEDREPGVRENVSSAAVSE